MNDILGLTAILVVCLFTLLLACCWPKTSKILFTALFLRVTLILLGNSVIKLPESTGDARSFEGIAWNISQDGFVNTIYQFPGFESTSISWIIALFYSATDRSPIMAQSISLFFGISSVFLGLIIIRKIWNERSALNAGWIFAIYPSLILYSCLTLREAYVWFFLLVAIYGVVLWSENQNFKSIILAVAGFILATFFHGPMILGALTFLIIVLFEKVKLSIHLLKNYKINLEAVFVILLSIFLIIFYILGYINVPKIGTFQTAVNIDLLLETIKQRSVGEASYPSWLNPNSMFELIYKGPIRIIYFIFSPFPWDVEKFAHIAAMLDGIIFIIFGFLIFRNKKVILNNLALRSIFLIIMTYFLIFGLAMGNFGSAIRHRTKFLISIILIIAPFIPKLVFRKKTKK